ncbi:MAG: heme-binding protein [Lachnospiraceae bacterium]|nr:heme-binding protein [Lachnospiraceae bacterium]
MDKRQIEQIVASVVGQMGEKRITLEQAKFLMERVEERAKEIGVKAVVAVFDSGANPVAVHCMEDAFLASYDIAFQKAYTAVALKMSTIQLKGLSQPGGALYGIQNTNQGRIVIFGGGEPLVHNGRVLGGLGVSGGTEEQDTALAEYGKQIAKEAFSWQ